MEGNVVDAKGGQPLKKARITLRRVFEQGPLGGRNNAQLEADIARRVAEERNTPYNAVTDAAGKFVIPSVRPGRYRLYVERAGYVRAEYGQRQPGRLGAALTLDSGQKMRDLLFRLLEDAVITGRVTDEDGEPVISGQVQVLRLSYQRGQKQLVPMGGGSTNDRGEYRAFGLTPGRYYVSATAGGQAGPAGGSGNVRIISNSQGFDEVYAPSFYPGTTDPQNATPIQVGAGEEIVGIDLSIAPQRAFRVRGRITAPPQPEGGAGQRRGGIQAMLMRRVGTGSVSRAFAQQGDVDQDQGTFEFRAVLPGSYYLQAMAMGDRRWMMHREPVEVSRADAEGINVIITPGIDLTGKLRLEGAAGIELQRVRVQFVPNEDQQLGTNGGPVAADGTFTVQGISSSENYSITVQGLSSNFYLKSARIGGEEYAESGFTVQGKGSGVLEIVMSANGARVEGSVLDAENLPAAAATVVLVPAKKGRGNSALYRTSTTDAFGKFAMQGIPPGEYKLFAWDEVDATAWQDAEFLGPFEERGTPVTIREGTVLTTEVRLITNQ